MDYKRKHFSKAASKDFEVKCKLERSKACKYFKESFENDMKKYVPVTL